MTDPLFDPAELDEPLLILPPARRRHVETVETAPGYLTNSEESP